MPVIERIYHAIFGDPNEKRLNRYRKILSRIKKQEDVYTESVRTLDDVKRLTEEFRTRFAPIAEIEDTDERSRKKQAILDALLVEAFALHRHTCRLILDQIFTLSDDREYRWYIVPFDVQILGAIALHEGTIAEMRTGEGKTVVATIAAYLNALSGEGVHIVTVNDYLARRDATEMGVIYGALGLSTGVVTHRSRLPDKREAYKKDIVYVTNNELGFDYLRDNMSPKPQMRVLGTLSYAIIDEVDSILIDEARTPLIISAPDEEPTSKYLKYSELAKRLKQGEHYKLDEKHKSAHLTEEGIAEIEKALGIDNIYVSEQYNDIHHIENALKAGAAYERDRDYIVRDGRVHIIDEHTGRVLPGRRYSDGLHQAIEAKEGVEIQQESKTLASITFQNFFRLYEKLSGMTGTAKTEEEEFFRIYGLDVVVVPTNVPIARMDRADLLFKNEQGKYRFLVTLLKQAHEKGQPVLVGTVSVAKSERLSDMLSREGVPHKVLNAKQDAQEAEIIAAAGQPGAITIATNMAGRGTDIRLADEIRSLSWEIVIAEHRFALGGLWVIGTEKHETRRIDNQLRGRSGRQGDPGTSQFLVSSQDDIMRVFGGDALFSLFNSSYFASLPEDEPLAESRMLTRRIDSVQKQVEGRNFDIRKHVLEYDDVLNQHRKIIYARRRKVLESEDIHEAIEALLEQEIDEILSVTVGDAEPHEWDIEWLIQTIHVFAGEGVMRAETLETAHDRDELRTRILQILQEKITEVRNRFPDEETFTRYERGLLLQSIDTLWTAHIDRMSHLRQEVAFAGYAQKNPLIVYKDRAYGIFSELIREIGFKTLKWLFLAQKDSEIRESDMDMENLSMRRELISTPPLTQSSSASERPDERSESGVRVYRASPQKASGNPQTNANPANEPQYKNVGRNDPCPCGSGKKYKHCHGK